MRRNMAPPNLVPPPTSGESAIGKRKRRNIIASLSLRFGENRTPTSVKSTIWHRPTRPICQTWASIVPPRLSQDKLRQFSPTLTIMAGQHSEKAQYHLLD